MRTADLFGSTELAVKSSAGDYAERYATAMRLVDEAEKTIEAINGLDFDTAGELEFGRNARNYNWTASTWAERMKTMIKLNAWKRIAELTGIRATMGIKKEKEFSEWLEKPANLPDVTPEAIEGMLRMFIETATDNLREAVTEVFRLLTPSGRWSKYKTNSAFKIGKKVILTGMISGDFGFRRPCYYRDAEYRSIDKVFRMLDGKGLGTSYYGGLYDAVTEALREKRAEGETEYFKFKTYFNGNLHIEFKRLDLLTELNRIGGGGAPDLDKPRAEKRSTTTNTTMEGAAI